MSVRLEFFNIIIPIEKIEKHYPSGFKKYKEDAGLKSSDFGIWYDNYLVKDGAMNMLSIEFRLSDWERMGLQVIGYDDNGRKKFKDICVVNSSGKKSYKCDWLVIKNGEAFYKEDYQFEQSAITFKNDNGDTLLFSIKGYQYQNCYKDMYEHDKNWLNVWVKIKTNEAVYEAQDPTMLTWELKELLDWFVSISKAKVPKHKTITFIESTIYFKLQNENIKEGVNLNVHLCCELNPKHWETKDYVFATKLNQNEIKEVISKIRKLIKQYPKR